jgi:hypothetical protein
MLTKIENFIKSNESKKYFFLYLSFVIFLTVIFFSFPIYNNKLDFSTWNAIFYQMNHPFSKTNYDDLSHVSKLTFRVFPVFIGKIFKFNVFAFIVFQYIIGILLFRMILTIFNNILNNSLHAILLTFSFGFIYAGKVSFVELRGIFDGLAITLLVLSIYKPNVLIIYLSVFFAAWTDERALIASSFIFLYYVYDFYFKKSKKSLFFIISVVLSWASYFICRYLLTIIFDLKTNTGGINTETLAMNFEYAPLSFWGALEGFWLFIIIAFFAIKPKSWVFNLLIFISLFIIVLVSYFVFDVTRSLSFLFPLVFISLKVIKDQKERLLTNNVFYLVFALSFLFPAYYVGGQHISWSKPLFFELIFQYFTNS